MTDLPEGAAPNEGSGASQRHFPHLARRAIM